MLEQYASLAQGTSSRSSKLIHGGLRYLENLEFSLVRECLLERCYLLKNAPSLVQLRPVYIPVYKHSTRPVWMIRAGLTIYALLAGLNHDSRFKQIRDFSDPALQAINKQDLHAVFCYQEAQTDDASLTKAVMHSAQKMGAELKLNAEVQKIELAEKGGQIHYLQDSAEQHLHATCIVNAAGPWANRLLDRVLPEQKNMVVDLVQGTHIVLPIEWPNNIYYVESPIDGRPVFIMPWYQQLMIGTTEVLFKDHPSQSTPTQAEIEYLLATFDAHFPGMRDQSSQVVESFAGLRVLPRSQENSNQRSRETIFLVDREKRPRLVSIYGGKLTAYRATAKMTLNKLKTSLPTAKVIADTKNIPLVDI